MKREVGHNIARIQLEIQPTKLVRGQALTKTIAETDPNLVSQQYVLDDISRDDWYSDILFYLLNQ